MARIKIDGVVETVRYAPDGLISLVRVYLRRGAVWSDQLLLNRSELIAHLSGGKHYVTGARKPALGSVFETGLAIELSGGHIVTGGQPDGRDRLAGISVF